MTAQTIDAALTAIAAVAATASGVDTAPAFDIFNIKGNIFALTYLMTSDTEISEIGTMQDLATIACDVLAPFVDVMQVGLYDILIVTQNIKLAFIREATTGGDMFSNTITAYSHCRIEFVPSYIYGGIQYIGYRVIVEEAKLKYDL